MRKPKKKTFFIILAALVVIVFISLGAVNAMKSKQETGMSVKTAEIVKQDIESNIFTSGIVISKNSREITSDVSGKISAVLVKEGDKVKKGDLIAKIDSEKLEYELKKSQMELEIKKEKLDQLRKEGTRDLEATYKNAEIEYKDKLKDYKDKQALFESEVISKDELEGAKSLMEKAYNDYILAKKKYEDPNNLSEIKMQEKEVSAMEFEINKTKSDIEKTNIVSPIDGTRTEVNVSELYAVDSYTTMFRIEDMENLEVETNISEYDIGKVKLGQKVKVTNDGIEKKEYEGTVSYIAPNAFVEKDGQSTETVVKVKIDINDKNTEFKPNFSANVEINTANRKDVLVIPYEAIYAEKDGSKSVFIVKDGKAQKHAIETGIEADMVVEIVGGELKEGDLVILNPTERIQDGTTVDVNNGIQGRKGKK